MQYFVNSFRTAIKLFENKFARQLFQPISSLLTMSQSDLDLEKDDRQIRLWGPHG
jgi:hypothetical protein